MASPWSVALVAAVYFAAAELGLSLAFVAEQVTAVWPPTGIALAAVVLLGPRIWPGIALGAFLANLYTDASPAVAAGIAVGNTLEALLGGWLLRRAGMQPALERVVDVAALVLLAAFASTVVSATIGATSLCAGGLQPWSRFPALWSVWWIGDAIGALVMAPVLLTWLAPGRHARGRGTRSEAAAFGLVLLVVDAIVFTGRIGLAPAGYPLQYAAFPLVVWAAMRFGLRGAATTTLVTSAIAIWSTAQGLGPFAVASTHENLLLLQTFTAVVAVTGLLLAAAVCERDAAERRAAAEYERLRTGEERLRLALDAGHMAVWDWNVATGEVAWEGYTEAMIGLPPGAFAGTPEAFLDLVQADDRPAVQAAIVAAVERHADYVVQFRMVGPGGDVRWVAARGRVLADAGGRPARMLGVAIDVTERQQLTDELRAQAERLADGDRRKDEFLAMLAHELRNPMAPLSTALHLLARNAPDRDRFVAMASRQVTQLVRLVDDLLDVSRITRGMITLRREPVVFADVVGRAVEMVRVEVEARSQVFTVSLPAAPIRLLADPTRLAQVIANLLGNASKYTSPGGSIWLTAERLEGEVVLRVRDTGAGIAPDLLPHVFDLFVQGDASLARTAGGLGIGLTIVDRLVALHGGRVEVRSEGAGRGSEFTVTLPRLPDELMSPAEPDAPSAVVAAGGLRVLIVEDNVDMAESLATLLAHWGHQVQLAYDAASALEVAARARPEIILSDLGLPGMDGYELARRLRAEPAFGKVVLVALSGYGRPEDQRRALEAGFDHHLVKPPDLAQLARAPRTRGDVGERGTAAHAALTRRFNRRLRRRGLGDQRVALKNVVSFRLTLPSSTEKHRPGSLTWSWSVAASDPASSAAMPVGSAVWLALAFVAALDLQARLSDRTAAELHLQDAVGRRDRVLVLVALAVRWRAADRLPARLRAALLSRAVDDGLAGERPGLIVNAERVGRGAEHERRSEVGLGERGSAPELGEQRFLARRALLHEQRRLAPRVVAGVGRCRRMLTHVSDAGLAGARVAVIVARASRHAACRVEDRVGENLEIVAAPIVEGVRLVLARLIRDHHSRPRRTAVGEPEHVRRPVLVVVASEEHLDVARARVDLEIDVTLVGGVVEESVRVRGHAARHVRVRRRRRVCDGVGRDEVRRRHVDHVLTVDGIPRNGARGGSADEIEDPLFPRREIRAVVERHDAAAGDEEGVDRGDERGLGGRPAGAVRNAMGEVDQDVVGRRIWRQHGERRRGVRKVVGGDLGHDVDRDAAVRRDERRRDVTRLGELRIREAVWVHLVADDEDPQRVV